MRVDLSSFAIFTAVPLCALVATSGLIAQAAPAAADTAEKTIIRKPPPPDYFPLRYKYQWKYETKTNAGAKSSFKLTDIHDGRQVDKVVWHELETDTGNMIIHDWYIKSEGMVVYRNTEYVAAKATMKADFTPERRYIKDVLKDGDTWQWSGKGMMGVGIEETSTVSGPEEIVVPAGKFKAMKVVTKVTQSGVPCTKTYWYGPNVGLIKSRTENASVAQGAGGAGTVVPTVLISDTELQEYQFPKLEKGEYEAELEKNQDR